ncbi:hypothetical protein [Roseomonas indoligenes]|uniref:Uncharacterized protein n=1 Tax=Roseomonas indoligenes TaxID=2820811 RepID=A0A940S9P0_9PROT|nr:hypothetical protein [Pararoseomonas indoligenes]MBP0495357.1 hypothetical protein [Pararoseomonas indoligenes]
MPGPCAIIAAPQFGRGHGMPMLEKPLDALGAMGAGFLALDEIRPAFRARAAA